VHPYLREELERLLPSDEIDALERRIETREQVERELAALALDRSHYFEVLDRVHVASVQLEEHVGGHPVLRRHPELAAIYERAAEALAELYQAVGRRPELSEYP
jgi:hypothetical protein